MRAAALILSMLGCTPTGEPVDDDRTADLVDPADVPMTPGPPVTRRLTRVQYGRAVSSLFGEGLQISVALEPDAQVDGLSALGQGQAATSPRGVEEYEVAAYEVAAQAVTADRRADWIACTPTLDDDACVRTSLSALALRAWRRPPRQDEVEGLVSVTTAAGDALGDPWRGLEFGLAAVLQSPHFLFRVEEGEDDPAGGRRLTAHELASRLSFLLWDAPPDPELLAAADSGELDTRSGIETQALRMIEDPRARDGLRAWFTDVLDLDRLDGLDKDPVLFPNISPTLGAAAREETLATLEHIVFTRDDDLRTLATTTTTFVNRELAALYRVEAPTLEGHAQVELPSDARRRGLFGQAAFLALNSHTTSTSATLRGLAIREGLLCDPPPPPPSGVDTSIPESDVDRPTLRDRVELHLTNPSCAGCHQKMDLLGLALENYDALGGWRDTENGVAIDASGDLGDVAFDGPDGLAKAVRGSDLFTGCFVTQAVRRALGREPVDGEAAVVDALTEAFELRDARAVPLWLDLVTHPLFRRLEAE